MGSKYRALRMIGTIYKALGIATAVLTVLAALGACLGPILGAAVVMPLAEQAWGGPLPLGNLGGILGGIFAGLAALIPGAVASFALYAMGEGIYLLLAIEENTRTTSTMLQQWAAGYQSTGYQQTDAQPYYEQ